MACFKPCDEEPGCHNNPRGLVGIGGGFGLRAGIAAGEASQREVAAYVEESMYYKYLNIQCSEICTLVHWYTGTLVYEKFHTEI